MLEGREMNTRNDGQLSGLFERREIEIATTTDVRQNANAHVQKLSAQQLSNLKAAMSAGSTNESDHRKAVMHRRGEEA
jgi:hypothetical protein